MRGVPAVTAMADNTGALVREAERVNRALEHENHGPLSLAHGFLPARPPALVLPDSHRLWDEVATELPELYARLRLRSRLEGLPRLDAGPKALPDHALQRAATVLGILVHAYHRVEPRLDTPTPESVLVPWHQLCARLGRTTPFLSYVDLIVANWRHREPARPGPVRVEDLRLLVPTVGVDAEQFFYLTQLEMLARGTPLVEEAVRACAAVAADNAPAVAAALERMADTVSDVSRGGLPKIDPRRGRRFHVDPVVWAKTVAPLAVPLAKGGLGPSGTASPMFHLLDVVVGRTQHRSFIGEEAAKLRRSYPPHWRDFIEAVAAAGVADYAERTGYPVLDRALTDLRACYSGDGGLLWRHRRKVAGYLDTSFRVGRDVTISGFPAAVRVGEELAASRGERPQPHPHLHSEEPVSESTAVLPSTVVTPGGLLRAHRGARRQWLGVRGAVIDVTDFLKAHPGGVAPIAGYLGTDATAAYEHVDHHRQAGILTRTAALAVGELRRPTLPKGPIATAYETWQRWAVVLTRQANVLDTDCTIRQARTSLASGEGELTPYTLQFAIEAHERFVERTLSTITGTALPELAATVWTLSPGTVVNLPKAEVTTGVLYRAMEMDELTDVEHRWRQVMARDETLLHRVREALCDGVDALEGSGRAASDQLGEVLAGLLRRMTWAVSDYAAD